MRYLGARPLGVKMAPLSQQKCSFNVFPGGKLAEEEGVSTAGSSSVDDKEGKEGKEEEEDEGDTAGPPTPRASSRGSVRRRRAKTPAVASWEEGEGGRTDDSFYGTHTPHAAQTLTRKREVVSTIL